MDFKAKYLEMMECLKAGKRPYFKLSSDQFIELKQYYTLALEQENKEHIHQVHFLLETVGSYSKLFDDLLYQYMETEVDPESLIVCLGAIQKQVIDRCSKEGERPPSSLFALLRKLLLH